MSIALASLAIAALIGVALSVAALERQAQRSAARKVRVHPRYNER